MEEHYNSKNLYYLSDSHGEEESSERSSTFEEVSQYTSTMISTSSGALLLKASSPAVMSNTASDLKALPTAPTASVSRTPSPFYISCRINSFKTWKITSVWKHQDKFY